MILLHLFHSFVPRILDTPHMRVVLRAAAVAVLAIVVAGAVSRGDESVAPEAATPEAAEAPSASATGDASPTGRGNVSIIHVAEPAEHAADVSSTDETSTGEPASSESVDEPVPAAPHEASHPAGPATESTASRIGEAEGQPTGTAAAASAIVHPSQPDAHVESPGPVTPSVSQSVGSGHASSDGRPGPVEDFAESGRRFWQVGDFAAAEKAFMRALSANEPDEHKRGLVLEMAGLYRAAGQHSRAAAILEKFVKTYPGDREIPHVLLQLGAIYRELGVYSMATARFFQVLNTTLRVNDEDIPEYRRLAMKARLEIAETFAVQGNLAEAERYFSRLQLLELEPADRERVMLRGAQMQFTLRQWLQAEKALAEFLAVAPEGPHAPEARYMRARALEELGRKQEAVEEVVTLLRIPEPGDSEAARGNAYWKRRCANELANRFYEQGDFLGALAIYQALARASMEPTWRWPAIYQIGLCFERMDMPHRAAEAYDAILAPETAPAAGAKLPESLASLQDMAKWRRSHLVWIEDKAKQLQSLSADDPAGT